MTASIVIPACNEAEHIGTLLDTLLEATETCPLRIVVACNGCTDATEDVARSRPGVEVLVTQVAAKHVALNDGDVAAGDSFPRLYADADIRTDAGSIRALIDALRTDAPMAVGPSVRYDLTKSPWLVRSFVRTNERLPFNEFWHATHLQGRGLYGANRSGRARFDTFPHLRSDDGFFDLQFDDTERRVVTDAVVELPCATSVSELLRNQTRVVDGYKELTQWMAANQPERTTRFEGSSGKGWRDRDLWATSGFTRSLRRGEGWADAAGYAIVELLTRSSARAQRAAHKDIAWR